MDVNTKESTLLKIEDYSFYYPDVQKPALDHVNFRVHSGEFVLVCGKSGCGKSTLLRQIKSALRPYGKRTGRIWFEGKDLEETDLRTQSSKIGFVMQDPDHQIVTDKVWHELAFGMESLGYDTETIRLRVAEMASYFGIQNWFYKNVEELSGGQKQILNLASVMTMNPSLLILDEPTSQLDPIEASEFLQTLQKINRELGVAIVMTEHRLEEVFPIVDKVAVMESGKIFMEDIPARAGMYLKSVKHDMFVAMPAPMRIYAEIEKSADEEKCPLTVREGRAWIDKFHKNDSENRKSEPIQLDDNKKKEASGIGIPAIELREVWFRYDKNFPDVVKGLSMKVEKGEFFCILGGNGTGKSTALSLISRILEPWRGKIFIEGKDIKKWTDKELYRSCLGVVPQNPQSLFVKKTVRQELYEMTGEKKQKCGGEFPMDSDRKEAIEEMAKLMELTELMEHHPYDLSGGEQQRLALAKILLLRPHILLMDEPTKGMDACFKEKFAEILKKIKAKGVTILMVSHDIEFCAMYADRCGLFFDGGMVAVGEPRTFFSGNSFYTTSANRMARYWYPWAVTTKDVIRCLREK